MAMKHKCVQSLLKLQWHSTIVTAFPVLGVTLLAVKHTVCICAKKCEQEHLSLCSVGGLICFCKAVLT